MLDFSFIKQNVGIGLTILFACVIFVIVACLIDMWTAIQAVKATGGKISSHPLRRTGLKIVDYLILLLFILMGDILGLLCFESYDIPWLAVSMTIGILSIEGWSVVENYKIKKSNAADAADIFKEIVGCNSKKEAEKIVGRLYELQTEKRKRYEKK